MRGLFRHKLAWHERLIYFARPFRRLPVGSAAFLIAHPCKGADRRPPLMRRPRGGVWPTAKLPRAQKNKQLLLELDFCCRNSASAKVGQLSLELLVVLIARPCKGADRRPPLMRRPRGGVWPTAKLPRAQKNKQLLLELDFCCRNSASAKVGQLSLELLVVLIARPCKGADRRPAFLFRSRQFGFASRLRVRAAGAAGRQSTACHRMPVQRRRPAGASAKKQATFAGIGFLLSQFRERKKTSNFCWNCLLC